MSEFNYPSIDATVIKVVGIFDYDKKFAIQLVKECGYIATPALDYSNAQFYRDKYYKEFNEIMLTQSAENAVKSFEKKVEVSLKFKKHTSEIKAKVLQAEIKLFENNIGIFALTVEPESLDFQSLSDCLFCFRMFSSEVLEQEGNSSLHQWISKEFLGGKSLRSTKDKHVDSDDYSGSKFKIYSAISVNENDLVGYDRNQLLFELGTNAKLGSTAAGTYDAPSKDYFEKTMEHCVSAFNSSTGLALLDSYTVIGHDLFYTNGSLHRFSYASYSHVYFSIYLYNLYIKYNVFRFNSRFKENPVQYKESFEDFINEYNYSHISFDFLPNLIYSKMRAALGIEHEIKQFEKRLNSLAANIQEEQEKRQAALLGVISIISSISAVEPIIETTKQVREYTGLESTLFYFILSVVAIVLAVPILSYLFPHYAKKFWKRLNAYFTND